MDCAGNNDYFLSSGVTNFSERHGGVDSAMSVALVISGLAIGTAESGRLHRIRVN
jgi:hypothetical protein